jgi:hypothetical protein
VTISERIEAARRERRVLTRVFRAAWRLDQADRERAWSLVSARAEGISIRDSAQIDYERLCHGRGIRR